MKHKEYIGDWLLEHYKPTFLKKLDRYSIKSEFFKFCTTDVSEFNEIYQRCLDSDLMKIQRTPSGSFSVDGKNKLINRYAWDCTQHTNAQVRLTIIIGINAWCFKVQANQDEEVKPISGSTAFATFKRMCDAKGIDLDKYAVDNGKELKKAITYHKKVVKGREDPKGTTTGYDNCHHIDFHSSFPTGLVLTHPEFRPVIEELYEGRKTNPKYKSILNNTIGYMQSISCCNAKYAQLSLDAVTDNNARITKLSMKLLSAGRNLLMINVDGIWYQGEIYHDEDEGPNIGQWANDHINCKWRAKSSGSYEFIEDGKYYPVVQGCTGYDCVKPRTEWEWGDIYKTGKQLVYYFKDGIGLVENKIGD